MKYKYLLLKVCKRRRRAKSHRATWGHAEVGGEVEWAWWDKALCRGVRRKEQVKEGEQVQGRLV